MILKILLQEWTWELHGIAGEELQHPYCGQHNVSQPDERQLERKNLWLWLQPATGDGDQEEWQSR